MPTTNKTDTKKQEKRNFQQEFLETVANQYGTFSAATMAEAIKRQGKQLDQAMVDNGMSVEDVAKSQGIEIPKPKKWGPIEETPQNYGQRLKNVELMQKLLNGGGTKGVYGFDPRTGKVAQTAEVPENADVRNLTPAVDLSALPPEEGFIANALARKLYGVRGAKDGLPNIVAARVAGLTYDQIEDKIRMSSQSTEFQPFRDAAQSILVGKGESQRNVAFDALDDYAQKGDTEGSKEYLKNMARESAPVDQQNRIMGKERTVDLLNEIQGDINALEKSGAGMGFLRGSIEGLMGRIGRTVAPQFREAATKIAISIFNYRNAMSGVAFGKEESAEYKRVFPNPKNLNEVNTATITALNRVFKGDIEKFYQQRMGKNNYQKLFKQSTGNEDLSQMSDEELRAIISGGK
jgi:hypothetical protein